jgi:CRP/FNR family transcriptional regulator, anaerobic regulatory protein
VVGFLMAGELLGADGLGSGLHGCDAIALEDSVVCVVPYERVEQKALSAKDMQRKFHGLLGRELDRKQQLATVLSSGYSADMRVAAFIDDLARRLEALGFSGSSVNLRMTRQEIGSYLGLTLETVSRCLSKLSAAGVLRVSHRDLKIIDRAALRRSATEPVR